MLYYDARLSANYPTVEVPVADVCLDPDDAVLLAALARALVVTASAAVHEPAPQVPVEVLRSAAWVAARNGVRGTLVDPQTLQARPAADVLSALRRHTAAALEQTSDADLIPNPPSILAS
jgi:carboxylate-amine ligase